MTDLLWEASLRITVVAAIATLGSLAARTAAARHAVWTAVLCAMLLMPALTFVVRPIAVPILQAPAVATYQAAPLSTPVQGRRAESASPAKESLHVPWLAVLYGLGVMIFGVRLGRAWLLSRRLIAGGASVPGLVQVRQSDSVSVPITLGLRTPIVLLPREWSEWTGWKLRAVLAHEFAHIERRDTRVAALAALNVCVFWFHPLAWWLQRELAAYAERAADDAAVLATGDREAYAELLLDVVSGLKKSQIVTGVAMARNSKIGSRIHRILDDSRHLSAVMNWSGWLALVMAAVPLVYAAAAVQAVPRTPATPAQERVAVIAQAGDIASLEAKIKANPEDAESRAKLAVLYLGAGNREGRLEQVMWLIEHRPNSMYAHSYFAPGRSPAEPMEDYLKICEAWRKQVDLHPAEPAVLINAAERMRWGFPEESEALLKRALQVNPADMTATARLAILYSQVIEAATAGTEKKPEMAKRVQEELLASNNAALLSLVGGGLANSTSAPAVNEFGKRLVERAQALDPSRSQTPASDPPQNQIRVGGPIQAAKLTNKVDPVYPPLAKQARIQGVVRFNATIAKDGTVKSLVVINGHPLLIPAAQDAVKHWEYQPTLLNGQPVEVITQVDVNFTLGPAAPQASAESPTRIRMGGGVQSSKLIRKVDPEYPPLAKQARIQGTVRFTATIGKDGKVADVQVISGHPLLIPAAMDAVKQYEYQPTLLNGQPVEVVTQVDVNFTLQP